MSMIIENAKRLATEAHQGQKRKFGPERDFICHPEEVAAKVATLLYVTDEDIAAAWLHDVIEDRAFRDGNENEWHVRILEECGMDVLRLVIELTNTTHGPEWEGKTREEKREEDQNRMRKISKRAQQIKLVDRWCNMRDMAGAQHEFLRKYIRESRVLVEICGMANLVMAFELTNEINKVEAGLV